MSSRPQCSPVCSTAIHHTILPANNHVERDHVLGVSTSARFNSNLISIWNKQGYNPKAIKALEEVILQRLSPELRPTAEKSYFYKRHDEHDGYQAAVEAALGSTTDRSNTLE